MLLRDSIFPTKEENNENCIFFLAFTSISCYVESGIKLPEITRRLPGAVKLKVEGDVENVQSFRHNKMAFDISVNQCKW